MSVRVRRALLGLFGALVVLVAIVVVRTARFGRNTQDTSPVRQAGVAADLGDPAAIGRLGEAIRIPTVSYFDSAAKISEFRKLHAFFERSYPLVHARMRREVLDSGTLLYTWRGSDTALAPVVFMGHQDVVPVEPGTEKDWRHGAFSGDTAEGSVWGRGTLDDKISVLGLLEGAEILMKRGVQPRRTVIFAFGHTEEVGGPSAERTAALLESRGVRPLFVMDEGGVVGQGLVPGVPGVVALVGVAEKGYLTLRLTARARGGHSSMPQPETAVSLLAAAVSKVQRTPLPAHLNHATVAMFNTVGPSMDYPRRMVMANLWLFESLLESQLAKMPSGNAMIRTTTAATMISGGIKDNVVPSSAQAVINFRLLPGDSVDWVLRRVKEMISDERVFVDTVNGLAKEATGVAPQDSEGFKMIAQAIRETWSGALVSPYLVFGGTDARHFYRITPNVYRFAPILVQGETLSLLHGTNERVALKDYLGAIGFYTRLIESSIR